MQPPRRVFREPAFFNKVYRMRRHGIKLVLVVCLGWAAGCEHSCFVKECDIGQDTSAGLPPNLESVSAESLIPACSPIAPPTTVVDLQRNPHYLSLAEAIAIALEQGTTGNPGLNGTTNDNLLSFQGRGVVSQENSIRILAMEPAIAATDMDTSLSKFDALWNTSMTWQRTNQPVGGNLLTSLENGDAATYTSALQKPLPTGGVAGITFNTQYTLLSQPPAGFVNPAYRPSLQFQFEQPLLQGFGVEINQLRATHPGSVLNPFPTVGRVEGILITRLRFDQQRSEFERQVHILLVNVEVAYWNLYGAYWNLYSRTEAMTQSVKAWSINQTRFRNGIISAVELAQTRGQYELFRGQRLEALNQVLENEHQLRGLLGMPLEDGSRLVPVDTPTLAPYQPDWTMSLNEALGSLPELVIARQELKARQLEVINQKNLLLPDLRFTSSYDINGLGTHLDGGENDPNNAFGSLANNQFHDWSLGLRMQVPLGFREAHAAVRSARLRLAQGFLVLRDQEYKAGRLLAQQYRQVSATYEQIKALQAQREAQAAQLQGRFKDFLAGSGSLDLLLEAQRFWSDALRNEYAAIVEYNNALARFEFAKGSIMQHDNVVIAEGALPRCSHERAVEHERQRSEALVLRQRAALASHSMEAQKPAFRTPEPAPTSAAELPTVMEDPPVVLQGTNQPFKLPENLGPSGEIKK